MRLLGLLPGLCTLTAAALIDIQFPHLLVPISAFSPDRPIGTQPTGEVSNHVYTLVSFDVPGANAAESCRIGFNINKSPAKNAPHEFGGEVPYTFEVFSVKSPINKDADSWNRHPEAGNWIATISIDEKYNVKVDGGWVECKKWNVNQFILKPKGDRKVRVWWYELDYGWDIGGPNGITLELHAWH